MISPKRALLWWIGALRLWRRVPLRLTLVCLTPIVAEAALQFIPLVGVVLSKIVVPLLSLGVLVVIDGVWRTGTFTMRGFLWSFRKENFWNALQAALLSLVVFAFQMLVAFAVYGYGVIDAVIFGRMAAHKELISSTFVLVLILPGVLPGILLIFLAPLVVFDKVRPVRAAVTSVRTLALSPVAFLLTCAVCALLLAAALTLAFGLPMLLVLPWTTLMGYAAYRDVFPGADGIPVRAV